jgi:hypothetical protein
MRAGNESWAVLFKQDVIGHTEKDLEAFLRENDWSIHLVDRTEKILRFSKLILHFNVSIDGLYFPILGKQCSNQYMEMLSDITDAKDKPDVLNDFNYAIVFPSDVIIGTVASCYLSMINRHRNQLCHQLEEIYWGNARIFKKLVGPSKEHLYRELNE